MSHVKFRPSIGAESPQRTRRSASLHRPGQGGGPPSVASAEVIGEAVVEIHGRTRAPGHVSRFHALIGSVCLIFFTSCHKPADTPAASKAPREHPVTIAAATQEDAPLYLDAIGKCAAVQAVAIQPQVSGVLTQVHFKQGQKVKKGDALFTIDPRPYKAALDKAEAALLNDSAQHQNKEAQLKRSQELVQGEFISPQDLETLKADAASAAALVQSDRAAVESARINLEYCAITSPVDGVTGILAVDAGNVVAPGANSTLVTVQTQDPIYADFIMAERDLPAIRDHAAKGVLKLAITSVEDPKKSRAGELTVIDNAVQADTGTVRLRATIPNGDGLFWPGQFVDVRLVLETVAGMIMVPAEAVQIGQKGRFVFVMKPDKTVEMRFVKVGQLHGEKISITEGVKPGESVVVTGQISLSPGAKVKVVESEEKASTKE